MSSIANELYLQKFPKLNDVNELVGKCLSAFNEDTLKERESALIAQRLLLVSLRNAISLAIEAPIVKIFLTNDEWKLEHFYLYISHFNSQSLDDLIHTFYAWYSFVFVFEFFTKYFINNNNNKGILQV